MSHEGGITSPFTPRPTRTSSPPRPPSAVSELPAGLRSSVALFLNDEIISKVPVLWNYSQPRASSLVVFFFDSTRDTDDAADDDGRRHSSRLLCFVVVAHLAVCVSSRRGRCRSCATSSRTRAHGSCRRSSRSRSGWARRSRPRATSRARCTLSARACCRWSSCSRCRWWCGGAMDGHLSTKGTGVGSSYVTIRPCDPHRTSLLSRATARQAAAAEDAARARAAQLGLQRARGGGQRAARGRRAGGILRLVSFQMDGG